MLKDFLKGKTSESMSFPEVLFEFILKNKPLGNGLRVLKVKIVLELEVGEFNGELSWLFDFNNHFYISCADYKQVCGLMCLTVVIKSFFSKPCGVLECEKAEETDNN